MVSKNNIMGEVNSFYNVEEIYYSIKTVYKSNNFNKLRHMSKVRNKIYIHIPESMQIRLWTATRVKFLFALNVYLKQII